MNKNLRDAMILTITDPLDQKFEQMIALQNDAKELIDDLCNENELEEITRMLRRSLKLQEEISELLAQDADDIPFDQFQKMIIARSDKITTAFFMAESTEDQFQAYFDKFKKGEPLDEIIHQAVKDAYEDEK